MSKHISGDWTFTDYGPNSGNAIRGEIVSGNTHLFDVVDSADNGLKPSHVVANAKLVCAAKDLLREAEADMESLIDLRDNHLLHAAAVVRALVQKRIEATQAAIAKAT